MRTKQDLTTQQINLGQNMTRYRDCTPDMRTKQDLTTKQVNLVHNMTNIRECTPIQISVARQEESSNDITVSSCSFQDIPKTRAKSPGNPDLEQCTKNVFPFKS